MGLFVRLLGVVFLAGIVTLCVLLAKRLPPFQAGSFLSSKLGLDAGTTSSSSSSSSTATSAPISAAATSTSTTGGAASSTTPTTQATPLYSSVTGADMPGSDIPVNGAGSAASQSTYGPTGCQAICSSNNKCQAAVYSPSTQQCWMKPAVNVGGIVSAADRVLMPQGKPASGNPHSSMRYDGPNALSLSLPSAGDCSSLCASLPFSVCQASVYGPSTTCSIKSNASNLTLDQNYTSWSHVP